MIFDAVTALVGRVLFFRRAVSVLAIALSYPVGASAQLSPPNAAGVAMGHLHYHVRDVAANKRFWIALGGREVASGAARAAGATEVLKFPDVLVFLTQGESTGGTEGSVLNHVAFRVPSLSAVEAAGLEVARLQQFPGVASVMTPEGERIELFENAATNLTFTFDAGHESEPDTTAAQRHNRPLSLPVAFHHIHLYVPDGDAPKAKAWYARMFGGVPGKRSQYEATDLPGINLNFSTAPRPTVALKGRMLAHIGFEVRRLEAFCTRLQAMGVTLDVPYSKRGALASASLTDPWGTSIELTEGLGGI